MDERMEPAELNVNVSMLTPLRRAYRRDVKAIAERLALKFQARKFDNTAAGGDGCPFNDLEDFCARLSICRNNASARIVLAVSKYAAKAPTDPSNEAAPDPENTWRDYAAWCLARDVHDEAIARGWARSRAERTWEHLQRNAEAR
jgi:hypothetical protein